MRLLPFRVSQVPGVTFQASASAPLVFARDTVMVTVHLHTRAVPQKVSSLGAGSHLGAVRPSITLICIRRGVALTGRWLCPDLTAVGCRLGFKLTGLIAVGCRLGFKLTGLTAGGRWLGFGLNPPGIMHPILVISLPSSNSQQHYKQHHHNKTLQFYPLPRVMEQHHTNA